MRGKNHRSLVIMDGQVGDFRVGAAEPTVGILGNINHGGAGGQGVVDEQVSRQAVPRY